MGDIRLIAGFVTGVFIALTGLAIYIDDQNKALVFGCVATLGLIGGVMATGGDRAKVAAGLVDPNRHTQGEWRLRPGVTGAPIVETDEREIAKVLYHGGSEDSEVLMNARLIVAAPVMLKALHATVAYENHFQACDQCDYEYGPCQTGRALKAEAKAAHRRALAKIRGEG